MTFFTAVFPESHPIFKMSYINPDSELLYPEIKHGWKISIDVHWFSHRCPWLRGISLQTSMKKSLSSHRFSHLPWFSPWFSSPPLQFWALKILPRRAWAVQLCVPRWWQEACPWGRRWQFQGISKGFEYDRLCIYTIIYIYICTVYNIIIYIVIPPFNPGIFGGG